MLKLFFWALFVFGLSGSQASAWDNHVDVTHYALQAYEGWGDCPYENIERVLPVLAVESNGVTKTPKNLEELGALLRFHVEKVKWDWRPSTAEFTPADVLAYSAAEPDDGMDQNLSLSPDQKYMGGFTGLPSQSIRHMYYRRFDPMAPLATFHIPLHAMGYAPERAEIFFNLAVQAKKNGHYFWAYRFLGIGLHYVQDIGQPYHATQFASFKLLALGHLIRHGWESFVAETTRLVSNFHLSFEEYAKLSLRSTTSSMEESDLVMAFKVPKSDQGFKISLEQNAELPIREGVKNLAAVGSVIASKIVSSQNSLMGGTLFRPDIEISKGFYDAEGRAKVNFAAFESNKEMREPLAEFREALFEAYSNTGIATRWYVDRFRAIGETEGRN